MINTASMVQTVRRVDKNTSSLIIFKTLLCIGSIAQWMTPHFFKFAREEVGAQFQITAGLLPLLFLVRLFFFSFIVFLPFGLFPCFSFARFLRKRVPSYL